MENHILILFVIIAGNAALPLFARTLKVPAATLEIIYGVILFNTIFRGKPQWVDMLQELGLIYLMFIAGMELDLKMLFNGKQTFYYVLTPAVTLLALPLLFASIGYSFYVGVVLAMFSAGITIVILKETNMIDSTGGKESLGVVLMGEFLAIAVLTCIDIYGKYGVTAAALIQGLKLAFFIITAIVFLKSLRVIAWWSSVRVQQVMESKDPVEEGLRVVISIAFTGGMIAYLSGVEPILGAFMAGVIFSMVFKNKGILEDKINAIGFGFLTPFFFIGVGADFDIMLLASLPNILTASFLTVMLFVGRFTGFLVLLLARLKPLDALATTLISSMPFSLMIVAGNIGVKLGYIDKEISSAIVLAAIISSIVYPTIYKNLSGSLRQS